MKKTKIIVLVMAGCLLTGCMGENYLEDGTAFLEEKKYEDAVSSFQKEAEKEKNLDEAYRGMGIAYYEMQEYEKSLESFREALNQKAKETGTIYNFIAVCNMKLGNYEEAVKAFKKGMEMEDSSDELKREMQFNTITLYEKLGDWENAKAAVKEYLAVCPDDAKAVKEAEFLETR